MTRQGAAPWLVVVAAWALVYLPPFLAGRFLPARDLTATHLPWRAVWAAQVRAGHLPLWDPLSNQGRPLLANPNAMAAYPGTLLFLLASPETAEMLHIALHHLLLLGGLYMLARRSGAPPGAAAVAAAAVGTSGVAWSATTFLNVLASLAWGAWAIAAVAAPPTDVAAASRRALASGVALGMSFLAGEPVIAVLVAGVCGAVVCGVWPGDLRRWGGVTCLAALAVAAPVLVPLLAVYPETVRGTLGTPPGALAADALAPRRLVELLLPSALGPPLADPGGGFWAAPSFPWQRYYPTIFLPASVLLLLVSALPERRKLRIWWGIGAVTGILAVLLGQATVASAAARLPGLAHVRFAIKLLVPLTLALPPLAAAGWQCLATLPPTRRRRLALLVLLPSVVAALAAGPGQRAWRALLGIAYPASAANLARLGAGELAAALLGDAAALALPPLVLLVAGPQPHLVAGTAVVAGWLGARGVLRFDQAARWAAPPPALNRPSGTPPMICTLVGAPPAQQAGVPADLQRFWAARAALVPGYGTRWGAGYVLTRGPDGLEPVRGELVAALAAGLPDAERARLARALGASRVVAEAPLTGWAGEWVKGVWVGWADTPATPAYLARRLLPAEGVRAAIQAMTAEGFCAGEDAVVEGRGGVSRLPGGTVLADTGPPHHRTFQVVAEGPGFLVFRQSYLSAWQARVDGRSVPVQVVNGAQMGISIPAGAHTVEVFLSLAPYRLGALGPLLLLAVIPLRLATARRGRQSASGGPVRSSRAIPPAR